MFDVILARSPGFRYGAHPTIRPSRNRDVRWLIAASVVQHSNIVSCAGSGTLWKWSYAQIESYPSVSASSATSIAFAHFACGSGMDASSIFQPWGTNTPNSNGCDAISGTLPMRVPDRLVHRADERFAPG